MLYNCRLHSDKRKNPEFTYYRNLTLDEVLALTPGKELYLLRDMQKSVSRVRVNGKVRTWKTMPDRIEVSLKYGLRDYLTFNKFEALTWLVVPWDETNSEV